jgi:pentose-5-phosphate-3-epimerase
MKLALIYIRSPPIKAEGMKAGVAINPHTNIDLLEDVINDIDLVCIMSVLVLGTVLYRKHLY